MLYDRGVSLAYAGQQRTNARRSTRERSGDEVDRGENKSRCRAGERRIWTEIVIPHATAQKWNNQQRGRRVQEEEINSSARPCRHGVGPHRNWLIRIVRGPEIEPRETASRGGDQVEQPPAGEGTRKRKSCEKHISLFDPDGREADASKPEQAL